jgi:flagellar hook-associated protein 1 FlgK
MAINYFHSDPLSSAKSGLKAQYSSLEVISNNLANAANPDYSQKDVRHHARVINGTTTGVDIEGPIREVDQAKVQTVQKQTTVTRYLHSQSQSLGRLDQLFGEPQDGFSLGGRFTAIQEQIRHLINSPEAPINQSQVLYFLNDWMTTTKNMSYKFQNERLLADQSIGDSIGTINNLLRELYVNNQNLFSSFNSGRAWGDYADIQDRLLRDLAQYFDFNIVRSSDMSMQLYLKSGVTLLSRNQYATLSYTPAASVSPSDTAATLGQIFLGGSDITSDFVGGHIGGLLNIRDTVIPNNYQAPLDELALRVRDHINAIHNRGTGFPPPSSLTGARIFDAAGVLGPVPGTATMRMSGDLRIGIVDQTNGQFAVNPITVDLNTGGPFTITQMITNLNLALGANGTAALNASGQLVLTATNPNQGIALTYTGASEPILSFNATGGAVASTGLGFSHFFGLNDLITTGDRFIQDGTASIQGLSQLLSLNSTISTNPQYFSRTILSQSATAVAGNGAVYVGDNANAIALQQLFETNVNFSTAGAMSARLETLTSYINDIYHSHAILYENTSSLYTQQETVLNKSRQSLVAESGVNSQEMMMKLLQVNFAISVHSTLIKTIKEVLDSIQRIQ